MAYLMELKKRVTVALVGGSDLVKILEQMGGDNALHKFDFLFSENGLVAHKAGEPIGKMVSENCTTLNKHQYMF